MAWAAALVSLAIGLAGCKKKVTPPKVEPVTDAEAKTYADKLQKALKPCDAAAVSALLDVSAMVRLAAAASDAPEAMKRGFVKGAVSVGYKFGTQLCADDRSTYTVLRVTTVLGKTKALVRSHGDNGFNYLEVFIGRSESGSVLAYDVYQYLGGERFSEGLRNILDAAVGDRSVMKNPKKLQQTMARVQRLVSEKRHAEARAALGSLPPAIRNTQQVMLNDLLIAAELDEPTYLAAITAFEARFPDTPALDMVSIDGFVMRKQYAKAIAAVTKLRTRVGGDPYLDQLHANMLLLQNKYAEARPLVKKVLAEAPELEDAHWQWVSLLLADKKFPETAAALTQLQSRFSADITRSGLRSQPRYAEFVTSPAGKTFLGTLPAEDE